MSVTYESVLQESSKNRANAYAFKNIYPAYIILVIALAASVAFWQFMENKVESDNRTEFEKSLFSLQSRFQMALDEHIGIARSMKGLYDINSYVVRDMFELYGSIPVKTYPSIQTVGFATRVPFADIQNHISYAQSERYWTYSIHPPGKRDIYYPVLYIVPLDRNLSISGYDLGTKEEMLEAIKLSGEQNTISVTSVFSLRGDSLQGFVLFAPIYKPQDPFNTTPVVQSESTLNGIVFIEIIANEFIAYALGGGESTDKQIMFAVSDDRGREFYRSENYNVEQEALFQQNETLEIQNKKFILKVQSVPEFGSGFAALVPIITLAGSVVTSFLLFGFTVTTLTGRARAQEIASRITKSQRRIVETSRDIIGITDIHGVWKSINPAATVIFGFTDKEFIGTSLYEKMSVEYGAKLQKLVETAPEEGKIMNEVLMPTRDGDMRWISWNVSVSREDGLLYLIGRDITEQKLAEERIKLKSRQVELSRQFTSEAANFQSRFMTDVSFFFRTSITGILGYLELLVTKQYSSEDDLEFFVSEAYSSAEQLLSRTSDLVDVVDGEDEKAMFTIKPKALPPAETFESIQKEIITNLSEQTISFDGSIDAPPEYKIFTDKAQLSSAMTEVIGSLTAGMPTAHVDYMVQANPYENVIEIQLLVSGNQLASDIISLIGKTPKNDMIEALASDKENIMYRIAEASSRLRMMNGSLQVNVLGDGENVAMIALPLKKTISLASLKAKKQ